MASNLKNLLDAQAEAHKHLMSGIRDAVEYLVKRDGKITLYDEDDEYSYDWDELGFVGMNGSYRFLTIYIIDGTNKLEIKAEEAWDGGTYFFDEPMWEYDDIIVHNLASLLDVKMGEK